MACVADWMDVRKVGEFALPQTSSGFAETGKRCEHVGTRRQEVKRTTARMSHVSRAMRSGGEGKFDGGLAKVEGGWGQ